MSFTKKIITAGIIFIVFILLTMVFINWYTKHGESVIVPNFNGLTVEKAEDLASDNDLNIIIIDSVYKEDAKPLTITEQEPSSESKVKPGRNIYLTINTGIVPKVKMPKLTNGSSNLAMVLLKNSGLKIGRIDSVKSILGTGLVIRQFYNKKEIAPYTMIKKGSIIDIQVSKMVLNSDTNAIKAMDRNGVIDPNYIEPEPFEETN